MILNSLMFVFLVEIVWNLNEGIQYSIFNCIKYTITGVIQWFPNFLSLLSTSKKNKKSNRRSFKEKRIFVFCICNKN